MPPYQSPKLGEKLETKYVRIGRKIFVGREGYRDNHDQIVKLDDLEDSISIIRATNPTEVDAGWVGIKRDGDIIIVGDSATLDLPVPNYASEARETTKRDFAEQSLEHHVLGFRK
jgi:hypothetical protein